MKDRRLIGHRVSGRHRFAIRMSGDLKGKAILDLGCGSGWFEVIAIKMNCSRILGVDTDEAYINRARKEAPKAEFILGDAVKVVNELARDNCKFDMIAMFDLLEHISKQEVEHVLQAAYSLLEPRGGCLVISVPYRGLISTALDPAFYLGHHHYRSDEMRKTLTGAGFSVLRVVYAGGIWEQLSMIWLYIFKWLLASEMPFASFLEGLREKEYLRCRSNPGLLKACVTMFVEAGIEK